MSQNLWSRFDRHVVGITWHTAGVDTERHYVTVTQYIAVVQTTQ